MKKKKQLFLYVWENVLSDYTSGIAFALAESEEEARKLVKKECPYAPEGEFDEKPLKVTTKKAFTLYGGG